MCPFISRFYLENDESQTDPRKCAYCCLEDLWRCLATLYVCVTISFRAFSEIYKESEKTRELSYIISTFEKLVVVKMCDSSVSHSIIIEINND